MSRTETNYEMPSYSRADYAACKMGLHKLSRKRVVWGWISWFIPVERHYCACGSNCWVKYEGYFQEPYQNEPDGHKKWIEQFERMKVFEESRNLRELNIE